MTTKETAVAKKDDLRVVLGGLVPAIKAALPSVITPDRFVRISQSALSGNAMLQKCTPLSFCGALMTAAQLGLEPNTPLGQAYLIPYRNRQAGTVECQFQLGYKGLIALAYRSGQVASIQAEAVYEGDDFEYEMGLEPKLKHRPASSGRGKATHYYAVWKTKDGASGFAVMSAEDIRNHAKNFSKAVVGGKKSPWETNFDEMAKKTVLKKALKYAPIASDFQRGMASDNSVRDYNAGIDMLDAMPKTFDAEEAGEPEGGRVARRATAAEIIDGEADEIPMGETEKKKDVAEGDFLQ